jgi:hypothetical protein
MRAAGDNRANQSTILTQKVNGVRPTINANKTRSCQFAMLAAILVLVNTFFTPSLP